MNPAVFASEDSSSMEATMKSGETIRFSCGDCHIVFDLNVSPPADWVEQLELDDLDEIEPICCPFCGANELKKLHDRAVLGRP
jgi:hypothetical protein